MLKQLKNYLIVITSLYTLVPLHAQDAGQSIASITVDLKKETAPMEPVWAWFGYDEPNYTYMKDGKKTPFRNSGLKPGAGLCEDT